MRILLWPIAGATLLSVVASQSTAGEFLIPPAPGDSGDFSRNPIYVVGQTETFEFTTAFQNFSVNLLQESLDRAGATPGPSIFSVPNVAVTQFQWLVQLYDFDLAVSNVFYLILSSGLDDQPLISCHYFNLTDTASSSSTPTTTSTPISSGLSSPSAESSDPSSSDAYFTPSSTNPTLTVPTTTTTSTSTSPPNPSSASGLSIGAQAGLGVGAALAGLAAIIVAIVFYRRSRQSRSHVEPEGAAGHATRGGQYHPDNYAPDWYKVQTPVAELGSDGSRMAELPAGYR